MSAEHLIEAIKARDAARASELLEQDPSLVQSRNAAGESPVLTAVYYGAKEILQQLLEWGAELDPFEAAAVGDVDRLSDLVRVQPSVINRYSHDGFTPLALASYFGHAEAVRILLGKGADVNARSKNALQNDPLHNASAGNHPEVAALLLDAGADANKPEGRGWTPLHLAANGGYLELAQLLIARGADVNVRREGVTPLGEALAKGRAAVADLLRAHGAVE